MYEGHIFRLPSVYIMLIYVSVRTCVCVCVRERLLTLQMTYLYRIRNILCNLFLINICFPVCLRNISNKEGLWTRTRRGLARSPLAFHFTSISSLQLRDCAFVGWYERSMLITDNILSNITRTVIVQSLNRITQFGYKLTLNLLKMKSSLCYAQTVSHSSKDSVSETFR